MSLGVGGRSRWRWQKTNIEHNRIEFNSFCMLWSWKRLKELRADGGVGTPNETVKRYFLVQACECNFLWRTWNIHFTNVVHNTSV